MIRGFTVSALLILPLITTPAEPQEIPAAKDPLLSSVHSVVISEHKPFKKKIAAPDGLRFVSAELLDDSEEGESGEADSIFGEAIEVRSGNLSAESAPLPVP